MYSIRFEINLEKGAMCLSLQKRFDRIQNKTKTHCLLNPNWMNFELKSDLKRLFYLNSIGSEFRCDQRLRVDLSVDLGMNKYKRNTHHLQMQTEWISNFKKAILKDFLVRYRLQRCSGVTNTICSVSLLLKCEQVTNKTKTHCL